MIIKSIFINLRIYLLAFVILFIMTGNGIIAQTMDNPVKGEDIITEKEGEDELLDSLLLSVRIEMIEYANARKL